MQLNVDNNTIKQLVAESQKDGIQKLVVGAVIRKGGKFLLLERLPSDVMGGLVEPRTYPYMTLMICLPKLRTCLLAASVFVPHRLGEMLIPLFVLKSVSTGATLVSFSPALPPVFFDACIMTERTTSRLF